MAQARDDRRATRYPLPTSTPRLLPTPTPAPPAAPSPPSLLDVLRVNPDLSTARQLFEAVKLPPALTDGEQYTFFIPTDAAFNALPDGALSALRNNPTALQRLLLYHIVPGALGMGALSNPAVLTTASGEALPVQVRDGALRIKNAGLVAGDVVLRNGVAHTLDGVLLPPAPVQTPAIDASGAATFRGSYLTVVGSAEPGATIILEANGERFGATLADSQGHWVIPNTISPGAYTLLAYALDATGIPLAVSAPVQLNVLP
jgi:uncharacterized surface protein with fasciclin (FAS1) repeats